MMPVVGVPQPRIDHSRSLWCGNVTPQMNEQFVLALFGGVPEKPTQVKLIRDKITGMLQNFCFIEFTTKDDAERVLNQLNGQPVPLPPGWPELTWRLGWASGGQNKQPKHGGYNGHAAYGGYGHGFYPGPQGPPQMGGGGQGNALTVFVGDIPLTVSEDEALMGEFAAEFPGMEIASAHIIRDPLTKSSKGFGFVTLVSDLDVRQVLAAGTMNVAGQPCRIKPAMHKKPMNQQNAALAAAALHQQQQQMYYAAYGMQHWPPGVQGMPPPQWGPPPNAIPYQQNGYPPY